MSEQLEYDSVGRTHTCPSIFQGQHGEDTDGMGAMSLFGGTACSHTSVVFVDNITDSGHDRREQRALRVGFGRGYPCNTQ